MAKIKKKAVKNTRTGTNALGIQRAINKDYAHLGKDYGKLFVEIWRMPYTKLILGGVALGALVPFVMKQLQGTTAVSTALQDGLDKIKERFPILSRTSEDTIYPE